MAKVNYLGATLGKTTQQMISQLFEEYNIPKESQVALDDLHITIFKQENLFEYNLTKEQKQLLEALDFNEVEIDYWQPAGDQMVLKVKSQFCDDIFEQLAKQAKPIHENYIQHITIARNLDESVLNKLPERLTKVKLKYYPIITSLYTEVK